MHPKLIKVLQTICDSPDRLHEIFLTGDEYFFIFDGFIFSVVKRADSNPELGNYSFFVYPKWRGRLEDLAAAFEYGGDDSKPEVKFAVFHQSSLPDAEQHWLSDVYDTLQMRYLGLDAIFDTITQKS